MLVFGFKLDPVVYTVYTHIHKPTYIFDHYVYLVPTCAKFDLRQAFPNVTAASAWACLDASKAKPGQNLEKQINIA